MYEIKIIDQLESNFHTFKSILSNIPEELIRWRSEAGKWNFLEIVCHLNDEEREDFRTRVMQVLEDPSVTFPSIDPVGWVEQRNYAAKNFDTMLLRFLEERKLSVSLLREMKQPPWSNTYHHPKLGPLSGTLLLSNWLAHDYLHLRQLLKLKYDYHKQKSGEELSYAGNW